MLESIFLQNKNWLRVKNSCTRGVGRILDSHATPLVFISGYANTRNVFYCLILSSGNLALLSFKFLEKKFYFVYP